MAAMPNDSLAAIRNALLASPRVGILSHPAPDGDSIGSSVGLSHILTRLGIDVDLILPQPVPDQYRFLLTGVNCQRPPGDISGATVVVLDCSDTQRLAELGQDLSQAAQVINIDHHLHNTMFGHLNHVNPRAAAVGEILYEMFRDSGAITPQAAEALFTALYTDTGRFSYNNTTSAALIAAAGLLELGARPGHVFREVYENRSPDYLGFLSRALAKIQLLMDGRVAVVALEENFLDSHGIRDWELEGFIDYPRSIRGVEVAVLLRETGGKVKVSLRSVAVDVARIACQMGGGGHKNAAGATVSADLDQVKAKLVDILRQELDHERICGIG